ncbi:MAG: 2OG-Fe(II) oxygenase family protein [Chloroflexota bacterium]
MTVRYKIQELAWGQLADAEASARVIGEAFRASGVILLRDCPSQKATPPAVLHQAMAELFGLPEEKLLSYQVSDLKNEGGYIVSGAWRSLMLPEVWHLVSESRPSANPDRPANIWPSELPHLRGILAPYYEQLSETAGIVLSAVARFYGLPGNYFEQMRPGGDDVLRLCHYRNVPGSTPSGFAKHRDLSLITLFAQSTDPGLEFEVQPGQWEAVRVPDDGLMVGVMGALDWLTDGEMPALQHKVRSLTESGVDKRYSAAHFVNPRPDTQFVPLKAVTRGAMGDGVTFETWFQEHVRKAQRDGNYDD